VVPDWVVDDYNSRVSKEDRLPLKGSSTDKYSSDYLSDHRCRNAVNINKKYNTTDETQYSSEWPNPIANGCATLVILFFAAVFYFFVF
ncbi:MAG: hypothetical protein J6B02_04935, partial [Selenomonadales bacterium]|nr:hypothetical protein [Selenomonadales bacterium]